MSSTIHQGSGAASSFELPGFQNEKADQVVYALPQIASHRHFVRVPQYLAFFGRELSIVNSAQALQDSLKPFNHPQQPGCRTELSATATVLQIEVDKPTQYRRGGLSLSEEIFGNVVRTKLPARVCKPGG